VRAVLDTNVVASGLLWDGAPRQLLLAAREKRAQLYTSTPLLLELTDNPGARQVRAQARGGAVVD
jgi:predicted nucleic acid-binding protein